MGSRVRDKFGIFEPPSPPLDVPSEDVTGLTGCYTHRFGQGHRVYLPAAFRALGRTLVVSVHPGGFLRMDSPAVFNRLIQPLSPIAEKSPEAVLLLRRLAGSATFLRVDSRGRFALPPPLRQQAGMQQRVVFRGREDHVEAWAEERWEKAEATGELGN